MALEGKDFFRQREGAAPRPPPKRPTCRDCLEEDTNPSWGDGDRFYCRGCAGPELKTPAQYLKDTCHAYQSCDPNTP